MLVNHSVVHLYFMRWLVTILCAWLTMLTLAQSGIESKKNLLSFGVGGTHGLIGFSYERLITDNIGIEVGGGSFFGGGIKFYPEGNSSTKPAMYTGLLNAYYEMPFSDAQFINYLPMGFRFGNKWVLDFNIGIGLQWDGAFTQAYSGNKNLGYWGGIKFGRRF